jgi:raffinose/stachyose/melibiose transport system permease protein
MILPGVVIGIVWCQLYAPGDGLFVKLLASAGLPFPEGGFLGTGATALVAVIVTISWRYTGFHMVLFMAGIESIPEEQYEAARVDGAGAWQCFRWVTLPSLGPVIRISAVLSIVGSLKYFDLIWVMTRGGPPEHETELMTTYMYHVGIMGNRLGYGSALAVAGFLVSIAVVVVIFALTRRRTAEGASA